MITKRLIATVIIKNQQVVQSFGYRKYLPIGKPEIVVENLDRWGVDEIIILNIDSSINNRGPNYKLIESLKKINIKTPLIYGGGIKSLKDGIEIVKSGFERIVLDSLLHQDVEEIEKMSKILGQQAIIGCLPLSINKNKIMWLDYKSLSSLQVSMKEISNKFKNIISEFILIDWKNEGSIGNFDMKLTYAFKNIKNSQFILFGGLNNPTKLNKLFKMENISAIAIGNSLNYREHEYQSIKNKISFSHMRPKYYNDNKQ